MERLSRLLTSNDDSSFHELSRKDSAYGKVEKILHDDGWCWMPTREKEDTQTEEVSTKIILQLSGVGRCSSMVMIARTGLTGTRWRDSFV